MGWRIRKSFKLGPFRVNLSNSGISTSVGVKGARIRFTKRGTYASIGGQGIYYQKKLTMNTNTNRYVSNSSELAGQLQIAAGRKPLIFWLGIIPSFLILFILVTYLSKPIVTDKVYVPWFFVSKNSVHIRDTPSTSGKILATVDAGAHYKFVERTENNWLKIELTDSTYGFAKDDLGFVKPELASVKEIMPMQDSPRLRQAMVITIVISLILYCIWLARIDRNRRTVELNYQMNDTIKNLHEQFLECFREILTSNKIWTTLSTEENNDPKYHGGASRLVERAEVTSISQDKKPIRTFKTNVKIPHLNLRDLSFFFFPDQLIIQRQMNFAGIPYKNLNIITQEKRFIEEGIVPGDATIIDYTWKYRNKNGDPDLRFSINPRLPVCLYSEYHFQSMEGLNVVITTSKPDAMNRFASFINTISSFQENLRSNN